MEKLNIILNEINIKIFGKNEMDELRKEHIAKFKEYMNEDYEIEDERQVAYDDALEAVYLNNKYKPNLYQAQLVINNIINTLDDFGWSSYKAGSSATDSLSQFFTPTPSNLTEVQKFVKDYPDLKEFLIETFINLILTKNSTFDIIINKLNSGGFNDENPDQWNMFTKISLENINDTYSYKHYQGIKSTQEVLEIEEELSHEQEENQQQNYQENSQDQFVLQNSQDQYYQQNLQDEYYQQNSQDPNYQQNRFKKLKFNIYKEYEEWFKKFEKHMYSDNNAVSNEVNQELWQAEGPSGKVNTDESKGYNRLVRFLKILQSSFLKKDNNGNLIIPTNGIIELSGVSNILEQYNSTKVQKFVKKYPDLKQLLVDGYTYFIKEGKIKYSNYLYLLINGLRPPSTKFWNTYTSISIEENKYRLVFMKNKSISEILETEIVLGRKGSELNYDQIRWFKDFEQQIYGQNSEEDERLVNMELWKVDDKYDGDLTKSEGYARLKAFLNILNSSGMDYNGNLIQPTNGIIELASSTPATLGKIGKFDKFVKEYGEDTSNGKTYTIKNFLVDSYINFIKQEDENFIKIVNSLNSGGLDETGPSRWNIYTQVFKDENEINRSEGMSGLKKEIKELVSNSLWESKYKDWFNKFEDLMYSNTDEWTKEWPSSNRNIVSTLSSTSPEITESKGYEKLMSFLEMLDSIIPVKDSNGKFLMRNNRIVELLEDVEKQKKKKEEDAEKQKVNIKAQEVYDKLFREEYNVIFNKETITNPEEVIRKLEDGLTSQRVHIIGSKTHDSLYKHWLIIEDENYSFPKSVTYELIKKDIENQRSIYSLSPKLADLNETLKFSFNPKEEGYWFKDVELQTVDYGRKLGKKENIFREKVIGKLLEKIRNYYFISASPTDVADSLSEFLTPTPSNLTEIQKIVNRYPELKQLLVDAYKFFIKNSNNIDSLLMLNNEPLLTKIYVRKMRTSNKYYFYRIGDMHSLKILSDIKGYDINLLNRNQKTWFEIFDKKMFDKYNNWKVKSNTFEINPNSEANKKLDAFLKILKSSIKKDDDGNFVQPTNGIIELVEEADKVINEKADKIFKQINYNELERLYYEFDEQDVNKILDGSNISDLKITTIIEKLRDFLQQKGFVEEKNIEFEQEFYDQQEEFYDQQEEFYDEQLEFYDEQTEKEFYDQQEEFNDRREDIDYQREKEEYIAREKEYDLIFIKLLEKIRDEINPPVSIMPFGIQGADIVINTQSAADSLAEFFTPTPGAEIVVQSQSVADSLAEFFTSRPVQTQPTVDSLTEFSTFRPVQTQSTADSLAEFFSPPAVSEGANKQMTIEQSIRNDIDNQLINKFNLNNINVNNDSALDAYNLTNNFNDYTRIKNVSNDKREEMFNVIKDNKVILSDNNISLINNKLNNITVKNSVANNQKLKELGLDGIIREGSSITDILNKIDNKLDSDAYNTNLIESMRIIESRNKKIKEYIVDKFINAP